MVQGVVQLDQLQPTWPDANSEQNRGMSRWITKYVTQHAGQITYLQRGQLEVMQSQRQLYSIVWSAVDIPSPDNVEQQLERAMVVVWNGEGDHVRKY